MGRSARGERREALGGGAVGESCCWRGGARAAHRVAAWMSGYSLLCVGLQVSLAWWDQDDSAGMEGDHAVVVGGYGKLVAALAAQTSVLLQASIELVRNTH